MQVDLKSFEASTCSPARSPLLPTKESVCIPPGGRDCPHKMAPYPISPMPIIFRARQRAVMAFVVLSAYECEAVS